jgi:uncharacterized protein YciI
VPKEHYFAKLTPPRASFVQDMTAEERRLMEEHVQYTHEHFVAGKVLAYGPVLASDGPFGVAIYAVENEAEVHKIIENDPTARAGLNRFECYPMHLAEAQGKRG